MGAAGPWGRPGPASAVGVRVGEGAGHRRLVSLRAPSVVTALGPTTDHQDQPSGPYRLLCLISGLQSPVWPSPTLLHRHRDPRAPAAQARLAPASPLHLAALSLHLCALTPTCSSCHAASITPTPLWLLPCRISAWLAALLIHQDPGPPLPESRSQRLWPEPPGGSPSSSSCPLVFQRSLQPPSGSLSPGSQALLWPQAVQERLLHNNPLFAGFPARVNSRGRPNGA